MSDHDDTPSTEPTYYIKRYTGQRTGKLTGLLAVMYGPDLVSVHEDYTEAGEELVRLSLAKLRAAAAPVELPGEWSKDGPTVRGPNGSFVQFGEFLPDSVYLCCPMASGALIGVDCPASVLRHLLALPPQEDVRGALPEGWVVDECGDMLGPKGAEVYSDKGRTWIYNSDVDSACAAPTDVLRRHLLALSPQEDVRGALPEHVEGAIVFVNDLLGATLHGPLPQATVDRLMDCAAVLAHHVGPTAPRTEGGGDHGE